MVNGLLTAMTLLWQSMDSGVASVVLARGYVIPFFFFVQPLFVFFKKENESVPSSSFFFGRSKWIGIRCPSVW